MKRKKSDIQLLVNELIDKGFPFDSVKYSFEVTSEEFTLPINYDENLFDIAVSINSEVTELYVVNPDSKLLAKIKLFSEIAENKDILIFNVDIKNSKICNMDLISDNSIKSLCDYVNKINQNQSIKYRSFYRGHSSVSYNLKPSIYRESGRMSMRKGSKKYVNFEDKMYNQALTFCASEFPEENSTFENLVKMQHYEFPTRLLDLTTNSLVALFFAANDNTNKDGEVFVFELKKKDVYYYNDKKVNELSRLVKTSGSKKLGSKFNDIICVVPRQNIDRLINQNGAFFLFGSHDYKENSSNKRIPFRRFIISKDFKKDIIKQLHSCGIDEMELFPDLLSRLNYIKKHTRDFS